ncbi:carbohydrate ABC transporter permease [Amorphoplanes digitatis]|uniref:N,N'-diacetylchitobiose transport system permease protein n=1 Tax=Actinoplanes digitatis TaxID=1868 RepID=A0A7W7MSZ4_9ACTN|nr:sugar ABC transporter permease [Actinoplanes digitatis]MBB4765245.1 N,N'-diacetylchitobiose transport system permease protein [Actinoplanes digitatis]GID94697.1 sugar ABC transporter permease [Actinoplanes digitatis]
MSVVESPPARPASQAPAPGDGRARGRRRSATSGGYAPLALTLPALLLLAGLLGYPLVRMVVLSFQSLGLRQLFGDLPPDNVGFANYVKIFTTDTFYQVVARTIAFTVVSVVLTVVLGLAVALLMRRVAPSVRIAMIIAMMFVWAMPQLVATQIFRWLVDSDFGVLNYLIDLLPGVDFANHSWFADPIQGWIVITTIVVWAGIPFIAITLNAGLTQVPKELLEAATVDGASAWQTLRLITVPILKPLLIIVTTLSVIWNFGLFTQVYVVRNGRPEDEYQVLATWAYSIAFKNNNYGLGSAIAVVTVLLLLGVMAFYLRQMFKIGDVD